MTLRMADGPPKNLPPGLDAYAGYVDLSGIGITWPAVAQIPAKNHLSISVRGNPAMCADVEMYAMANWTGYTYGYCSIANAQRLINTMGRPKKLWIAHYGVGPHICNPDCGYGFTGQADGTQWIDHGGWDESLLADDFFVLNPPPTPTPTPPTEEDFMKPYVIVTSDTKRVYVLFPTGQIVYQQTAVLTEALEADGARVLTWAQADVDSVAKGYTP